MARESWTDERLDHFCQRMNERFDRVDERLDRIDGDLREICVALKDLHDDNRATNRVMMQGFVGLSGAIVTGCMAIAGASLF